MSQAPSPMVILMVEDNALQRREVEAQLVPLGHRIITAHNGHEAIQRMNQDMPDLIVMDAVMPTMDGFNACAMIKSNLKTASVPILVLTALSRDAKDRSYAAGADDFIRKPASTVLLQVRVQTHLRIRALSAKVGTLTEVRPKVLVVSASPLVRSQVQNHCGKDTAHFLEAQGESQARALILSERPDVLVLDTELVEGNARALAVAIHQNEELRDMPILLLYGPGELDLWSRLKEPMADALEKPLIAQETRRRVVLLAHLAHLQKLSHA